MVKQRFFLVCLLAANFFVYGQATNGDLNSRKVIANGNNSFFDYDVLEKRAGESGDFGFVAEYPNIKPTLPKAEFMIFETRFDKTDYTKLDMTKSGSLLYYYLHIDDSFETTLKKLTKFSLSLYPIEGCLPKELQQMGCQAYLPYSYADGKKVERDFLVVFHNDKIIRFVCYDGEYEILSKFYGAHGISVNTYIEVPSMDAIDRALSNYAFSYFGVATIRKEIEGLVYDCDCLSDFTEQLSRDKASAPITITRKEYLNYFDELDKKAKRLFNTKELFVAGLNLLDNYESAAKKIPSEEWQPIRAHVEKIAFVKELSGLQFGRNTILFYNDALGFLDVDIYDGELAYVLLQAFKKNSGTKVGLKIFGKTNSRYDSNNYYDSDFYEFSLNRIAVENVDGASAMFNLVVSKKGLFSDMN